MRAIRTILVAAALAAAFFAPTSCSRLSRGSSSPLIHLGQGWDSARASLAGWAGSRPDRAFQMQQLEGPQARAYPAIDSLLIAQVYANAGIRDSRFARLAALPVPEKPGVLCRENYIFYVSGNRIVGVEYRAVVSNGAGGYRQEDDAMGTVPGATLGGA